MIQQPAAQTVTADQPPRTLAWVALGGGLALSLAGNIVHAYPNPGPVVIGALLPPSLALCIELAIRYRWPVGPWWLLARFVLVLGVTAVMTVVSYLHMRALLQSWGMDWFSAAFLPLVPDALGLIGALALLAAKYLPPPPPVIAIDRTDYSTLTKSQAVLAAAAYVGHSPTAIRDHLAARDVDVSVSWASRQLTSLTAA